MTTSPSFTAGERWTYRTPEGFEQSRIIIGAVVTFAGREPIVCCAIPGAPRRLADGSVEGVTIPFLPMAASALAGSVLARDAHGDVPDGFASAFESWQTDPRGLTVFTVPFEGWLDTMIARQMANIVGAAAE